MLRGRAFYLERIAMPPGATLEVQLIGARGAAAPVTIATRTFSDLHGPPYDFTLSYAPARVSADMHCGLGAALRDREGRLEFATAAGVPVMPGSDARRIPPGARNRSLNAHRLASTIAAAVASAPANPADGARRPA